MPYEDLEIEIRHTADGGRETVLDTASHGRGREPFVLPFDDQALGRLMAALERRVWRSRIGSSQARELEGEDPEDSPGADTPSAEALGAALYEALFQGTNARVWYAAQERFATAEAGRPESTRTGLRLRFLQRRKNADPEGPQRLPWELILRPDTRHFLARDRSTPVVRSLETAEGVRPFAIDGAVRVLLVESVPTGRTALDTAVEARKVKEALAEVPGIAIEHLSRADFETFDDTLLRGRFHVVHFMGHAGFDSETGEPGIRLDSEGSREQWVPAGFLAEHVKRADSVWMVVLNACSTGALSRRGGRDAYTSTAEALVGSRVPAVVAMQFPISDRAAIAFSEAFYRALARQDDVEAAVSEGRLAIYRQDVLRPTRAVRSANPTLEWATPVLYVQGKEIRPFGRRNEPPPTADELASKPLRLGIRSMVGHGVGLEDETDDTLDLVEHFDGRYIRDPDLWHEEILPQIQEFLVEGIASRRPLILHLACHGSLAFAAGSFLEAKSGVELSVVQRGPKTSLFELPARPGEIPDAPLWQEPQSFLRNEDAKDLAVAVSVTHCIDSQVGLYLEESESSVRRLLHLAIRPEPSNTSVRDGAHALRLAQTLSREMRKRSAAEWRGTVHLFSAAPNALLVFLGQMAPALGTVQLYEFEFDKGSKTRTYRPSFRLPRE